MKNKKNIDFFLFTICFILGILFLLSFFHFKSGEKIISSALLNKKYEKEIEKIHLTRRNQDFLTMQKSGSLWYAHSGSLECFPVQTDLVENFIKDITNILSMYIISDGAEQIQKLNLTDESTADFSTSFSGKNNIVFSKIYYNLNESLVSKIIFRPDSSMRIYKSEDVSVRYFRTDAEIWGDPYLIPQFFYKNEGNGVSAQKIVLSEKTSDNRILFKDAPQPAFEMLLSMRHGNFTQIRRNDILEKNKTASITVHFGNNSKMVISFYKTENAGQLMYEALYDFFPGSTSSVETKYAVKKLKFAVYLSDWTYRKTVSLFTE